MADQIAKKRKRPEDGLGEAKKKKVPSLTQQPKPSGPSSIEVSKLLRPKTSPPVIGELLGMLIWKT
jgi:hypothetical protein